jgi:hypothetical protein
MVLEQIGSPPANIFSIEMLGFINDTMNIILKGALNSDPNSMAIVVVIIVALIVGLIILYNASKVMFGLVKRLMLFFIVILFVLGFFINFYDKIFVANPDPLYLLLGAFGVGTAIISLIISFVALSERAKAARTIRQQQIVEIKEKLKEQLSEEDYARMQNPTYTNANQQFNPTQISQPKMVTQQAYAQTIQKPRIAMEDAFTTHNLWSSVKDRSILTVFTYIVVSEFGVFSSVTVAAPNLTAGMILFVGFMIGAFIFIRKSYHSYLVGVSHLFLGTIFAILLSIVLGNFWGEIPLDTLLSTGYFTTPALVAVATGVAVSLFMGSKE